MAEGGWKSTFPRTSAVPPLLLGLLAAASALSAAPSVEQRTTARCAQGRSFGVRLSGDVAIVTLPGRSIRMARKPSRLGDAFRGDGSALMIDGDFAALVLSDDPDWRDCRLERGLPAP